MKFINLIRFFINFFDYFQQIKILKFLKKNLKGKITLFDIGSHHGETVKLFIKKFDIKEIHCFEASPINFKILSKEIKKLNLHENIYLNNLGIGSNNQDAFINQAEETSSSSINEFNKNSKYLKKKLKILNVKNYEKYYKKIPIKLIKLDNYIEKKKIIKIDILKIDTEGFELNVIKGLKLNNKKVKFIYFEHHYDDMIKKNYSFSNINKILNDYGFIKKYKSKMFFRKSFEYIYANKFI